MIKKIIVVISFLLIICSCAEKPVDDPGFSIYTYRPDMSGYKGVNSVKHSFLGTTVSELEKTINEKQSGAFVLSRESCKHCQMVMQLIDEAANELGVQVYYINGESESYPIVDTPDYDLLDSLIKSIEEANDDGEITPQTPHFFTVINGKFKDSIIGFDIKGEEPTQSEKETQMNKYKKALKVFAK